MRHKQTNTFARNPNKHTIAMENLGASRLGAAANGGDISREDTHDPKPRRRRRPRP